MEHSNQGLIKKTRAKDLLSNWNIPKRLRWTMLKEMVAIEFLQSETEDFFRVSQSAANKARMS